jgi:hypothetical protein
MLAFKVGDEVKWTSQSGGFRKEKLGKVVAVVPAAQKPQDFIPEGFNFGNDGRPRPHESYLIQIGKRRKLYWPRVEYLQLAS